jgi:hypothetical protein
MHPELTAFEETIEASFDKLYICRVKLSTLTFSVFFVS